MLQVRKNVFETNSSSTHSITITTKDEYDAWIKGEVYLNEYWGNTDSPYKDKKFVTREEAADILNHDKYFVKNREVVTEVSDYELYNWDFYPFKKYGLGLERYSHKYTSPSGDELVVLVCYGYDG